MFASISFSPAFNIRKAKVKGLGERNKEVGIIEV